MNHLPSRHQVLSLNNLRLLDKKTIVDQRSTERKQEVDEGVKLAKLVDNLRKTASEEQARLAKFREETLKQVKIEIGILIDEKMTLVEKVDDLKKEEEKLRIIPNFEWDKVLTQAEYLANLRRTLEEKENVFMQREVSLSEHEKQLEIERDRIAGEKTRITNDLAQARQSFGKAKEFEVEADRRLAEIKTYVEQERRLILDREAQVAVCEHDLELRKTTLDTRERELNNKEKFINDKYQTLLRTELRIKN